MNKIKILLAIPLAALLLTSCDIFTVYGSGDIIETQYSLENFTSISASNTCDLTVMRGDSYFIEVSCDDNIQSYVETYLNGNTLIINLESGRSYTNTTFKATVVLPELKYLEISGASSAEVSGFENSGDFTVDISGASDADIRFVSVGNIFSEVSGASYLNIDTVNSTGELTLQCSGASTADFKDVASVTGDIEISGASKSYVNVAGALNGSVSGASTLYYSGTPIINLSITEASDLNRL